MPKDGFGNIIMLGGLAVGGYFIYQWWTSQQAGPVNISNTTSGAPGTSAAATIQITQQLQTAAAANPIIQAQSGQADAYQWATLYNALAGTVNSTGVLISPPSISAVNINGTFFPSGLPANQSSLANTPGNSSQGLPLITASQFVAGLTAAGIRGISGFGQGPTTGPRITGTPTGVSLNKHCPWGYYEQNGQCIPLGSKMRAGSAGVSGLGQARMISVPAMLTPTSRRTMQLPGGTTPAEFQRRLRNVR